jgi:diamine N-acetyltransferase
LVNITYTETDAKDIDLIEPLWEQLREHHRVRSVYFTRHFETVTFEGRKSDLLNKAKNGPMRIDLARDIDANKYVGYCVSSLITDNFDLVGEVDSIYVDADYRFKGIGETLMKKALEWMDAKGASVKTVGVGVGNEEVFPFYARFGFYPRTTHLEQIKK